MYMLRKLTHNEFVRVALKKTVFANDVGARKPLVLGIYGASGVGKSSLALFWAEETLKAMGKKDLIDHIIEQHIVYRSKDALRVLDHCLGCELKLPIFINMEGREMLDSRASMSEYNKKITQSLILSRSIRPLVLIFCFQRLMDIDVRVREGFNLFAKIKSYIRSDGALIPPEAQYYEIRKKVANYKGKIEELAYMVPVPINNIKCSIVRARWSLPECFTLFKEVDKRMKLEILTEKSQKAVEPIDSVVEFIKECIATTNKSEGVQPNEIYKVFLKFCEERNYPTVSFQAFVNDMKKNIPIRARRSGGYSYWYGIELKKKG